MQSRITNLKRLEAFILTCGMLVTYQASSNISPAIIPERRQEFHMQLATGIVTTGRKELDGNYRSTRSSIGYKVKKGTQQNAQTKILNHKKHGRELINSMKRH